MDPYAAVFRICFDEVPRSLESFLAIRDRLMQGQSSGSPPDSGSLSESLLPAPIRTSPRFQEESSPTNFRVACLGAALYALALLVYACRDKVVGMQCIIACADRSILEKTSGSSPPPPQAVRGFVLVKRYGGFFRRFDQKLFWAKSYVRPPHSSSSFPAPCPANGYAFDVDANVPLEYMFYLQHLDVGHEAAHGTVRLFIHCSGSDGIPKSVFVRKNSKGVYKVDDVYCLHGIQEPVVVVPQEDLDEEI